MIERRNRKFKTEFISKEKIECMKNTILVKKSRISSCITDRINKTLVNEKIDFKKVISELEEILTKGEVNKVEINKSKDLSINTTINIFNKDNKHKFKTNNYLPSVDINYKLDKLKNKNQSQSQHSIFFRRENNKNISDNYFRILMKEDIKKVKYNILNSLNNSKINITDEFNIKEEIYRMKSGVEKPGNLLKTGKSILSLNPRFIKTKIVNKKLLFNKITQDSMNIHMYK